MIPVPLAIILIVIAAILGIGAVWVSGETRIFGAAAAVIAAIMSWYLALSMAAGNIGSVEVVPVEHVWDELGGNMTILYEEIPIIVSDAGLATLISGAAVILSLLAGILIIMAGIEIFSEVDQ